MAARVARALETCLSTVRIVLRPGVEPPLDLDVIRDLHETRAPIVGVHAALAACEACAVLVAACDLPELDPRVALALVALAPAEGGADIVAPVGPTGPEPLFAVYRPALLPELEQRIEAGNLSLRALLDASDTLLLPEEEIRRIDPELRSLRNVNRPQDL